METTFAVANKFLQLAGHDLQFPIIGHLITHMKLQKLVYFSHGWHLALGAGPLVNEPVRVGRYGPVFVSLYRELIEHENKFINRYIEQLCYHTDTDKFELIKPAVNDKFANEVIERIWELYGNYTAVQLSNLAHAFGTPWKRIALQYPDYLSRCINIPDKLICEYFKGLK